MTKVQKAQATLPGAWAFCCMVIFMATLYTGIVTDPTSLKFDDPQCTAEIMPGDIWFPCSLEPHSPSIQHQADVLGERILWIDSGQYWVVTVN